MARGRAREPRGEGGAPGALGPPCSGLPGASPGNLLDLLEMPEVSLRTALFLDGFCFAKASYFVFRIKQWLLWLSSRCFLLVSILLNTMCSAFLK